MCIRDRYYYCSGKTDRVFHQDSRFTQWFDYCARLNNPQSDIEDLTQLIDTLDAVSYTHLDVYKRQLLVHWP